MKKFAIIFIIAIVAVTTAFAADPFIKITTDIKNENPVFQLKATSTSAGTISDATASTATGTSVDADGAVTVPTDTLLKDDLTIKFEINQITDARTTQDYTITVVATDLKMSKDSEGTAITTPGTNQKFAVDATTPAVTAKTVTNVGLSAATNVLTVTYTGKNVTATKTLGTFECKWTHNDDAEVGAYEATITMTVAAK